MTINTSEPHYKTLGAYTGAGSVPDAHPEELKAAYTRIAQLENTLGECREYFESRADADCDQDGFIPNTEMTMMIEIDEVLL